jgi:NAD-dependent deacetylase
VVWFGEALPMEAWGAAARAAETCEVFLAVGTSSLVHPAAGLVHRARAAGAFTAEINLEETPASGAFHLALRGDLQEVLGSLGDPPGAGPRPAP